MATNLDLDDKLIIEAQKIGHHKITVTACRDATQKHFGAGEPSAEDGRVGSDMPGFGRKNILIEPLLQRQIVGQSAEQRHGQMGMRVNQSGHDDAPLGIDDLCGAGQGVVFFR